MPRRPTKAPRASAKLSSKPSAQPDPTPPVTTDENNLSASLASLTLVSPLPPRRVPRIPFPFLALPIELRLHVYDFFFLDSGRVIDLDLDNRRRVHQKLGLLRTCRAVYAEAFHHFYTTRSFRVFPTNPGKYFRTKKPLLARMKPHQRRALTTLQLRLGPSWNKPPRGWVVNPALGLGECVGVRKVGVFIECDPSDNAFRGFRQSDGFYERFSAGLLREVLAELPACNVVEFDAWPSVKKSGAMLRALLEVVADTGHVVRWGPERGWTDTSVDEVAPIKVELEDPSSMSWADMSLQSVMVLA